MSLIIVGFEVVVYTVVGLYIGMFLSDWIIEKFPYVEGMLSREPNLKYLPAAILGLSGMTVGFWRLYLWVKKNDQNSN